MQTASGLCEGRLSVTPNGIERSRIGSSTRGDAGVDEIGMRHSQYGSSTVREGTAYRPLSSRNPKEASWPNPLPIASARSLEPLQDRPTGLYQCSTFVFSRARVRENGRRTATITACHRKLQKASMERTGNEQGWVNGGSRHTRNGWVGFGNRSTIRWAGNQCRSLDRGTDALPPGRSPRRLSRSGMPSRADMNWTNRSLEPSLARTPVTVPARYAVRA